MATRENEEKNKDELKFEDMLNDLKIQTEIFKFMNNITRFRIISFLLISPRISLSNLHKKLARSKSTVTHHLEKIESSNILKTSTTSAQGSIDAKIYELIPKLILLNSFNPKELKKLKLNEKTKLILQVLSRDNALFEVLRYILEEATLINKGIEKTLTEDKILMDESSELSLDNLIDYNILLLSKNQYKKYLDLYSKFMNEVKEVIKQGSNDKENEEKPHLVLHSKIKLEDLAKFDKEKDSFRKFFNALDNK